ncbi:MAG: hypothetical protein LW817_02855 [Candidatus Caenarcaniphilales bacterium]|jgi:hypothetical protein|nr:hypothetical protein [Candidatus Caenarcaniphilales bacterium]
MKLLDLEPQANIFGRLYWDYSYKNRKILAPILIVLIVIISIVITWKFLSMQKQIHDLKQFEAIYVVALARDMDIGESINAQDLKPMIFYKEEFDHIKTQDQTSKQEVNSLFNCSVDQASGKIFGIENLIGRVVKIPVYKNSFLRQEYLANKDALPGLNSLLKANEALLDIEVPQNGFNIFIKPEDQLDVYDTSEATSKLAASGVRVLLVDSQPLGKAPWQVTYDQNAKRHITLAVPIDLIAKITKLNSSKALALTYHNKNIVINPIPVKAQIVRSSVKKAAKNQFQALTIIKGNQKEVIQQ